MGGRRWERDEGEGRLVQVGRRRGEAKVGPAAVLGGAPGLRWGWLK